MAVTSEIAARNNAELCHAVLAAHGISGNVTDDCWYSHEALPDLYPNVVTLAPAFDPGFLSSLNLAGAWAVKESFAALDLAPLGFAPIVDATWLSHPNPAAVAQNGQVIWEQIRAPETFDEWVSLWEQDNTDLTRSPMTPALLNGPTLRLLAGRHQGRIVAGCILNLSNDVIGLSNVIHAIQAPDDWLATCLAAIARRHPGRPIVDYEADDALPLMLAHGFKRIGPLRIWLKVA